MFGARAVGCELDARKTKHKANQFIFYKRTDKQTAVMHRSDQHVRGNHIRFTAGPYGTLQGFDRGHIFRGFE
jgi:hypothetical protein